MTTRPSTIKGSNPPSTPGRKPFGWRFTAPLLLGSTLNPINSSMIATGLVGIGSLIDITFGSATNDGGFHVLGWVLGGIGILVLLLAALDRSIPVVTDR